MAKFYENSILGPFWELFAHFKENNDFSGESIFVTFFCFQISITVQNFRKKTHDQIQQFLTDTYVQWDGWASMKNSWGNSE